MSETVAGNVTGANIARSSRRELLGSVAALGASALLPAQNGSAQNSAVVRQGKIDVHYHMGQRIPAGKEKPKSRRLNWTPEIAIEEMDRAGVAVGIISNPPGPFATRNETAAQLGKDFPGRFGLFAALNMPDTDASLKEIEYAINVLKADGFGILTSYGDLWLGDVKFRPVFEELNRRKAVVFVHPTDAPCCRPAAMTYIQPPMTGAWIDWPMHTARTIFSLMSNGTIRDFPGIRFIFAHSGGVMPLLAGRLKGLAADDDFGPETINRFFPDGVDNELKRCYFEIAQGFAPLNMYALRQIALDSCILFGSDYPFYHPITPAKGLAELHLPGELQRAIERDNAAALLPRWNI
jgi:6-methylsalicylate decarboxylase